MPHKIKRWAQIWIFAQGKCRRIFLGEQSAIGKAWSNRTNKSFLALIVVILFKSYINFSMRNAIVKENGFPEFSAID